MNNNQTEENIIWKCPNCETLNKENICQICGEKKPIGIRPFNVDNSDNGSDKMINILKNEYYYNGQVDGYKKAKKELLKKLKKSQLIFGVACFMITLLYVMTIVLILKI